MKRLLAILSAGVLLIAVPGAVLAQDEAFSGMLSGANEVPPVTSAAAGIAYVFISEDETEVKYAVSYTGLSGPPIAAHIHIGEPGTNGPIALPLDVGPSTMFGTLTRTDFQATPEAATWEAALDAIRAGKAYVNLHTSANPGGEVRAQLVETAAVTPAPTASPRPTGSVKNSTPPPTSTLPEVQRGSTTDMAPILFVMLVAVLSGGIAVRKLQPARNKRDGWN